MSDLIEQYTTADNKVHTVAYLKISLCLSSGCMCMCVCAPYKCEGKIFVVYSSNEPKQ